MNFSFLPKYLPYFNYGALITVLISILVVCLGTIIGVLLAFAQRSRFKPLVWFANVYVWIFRGTPMMVQAVFIYYALLNVIHWTNLQAAIFVISINTGAYMSEIVRSGIQSVDPGQMEAARSLGLSNGQAMLNVILPQAIRNAFPAIGNEFIVNIKDSSVLMIISITELMFQAKSIAGTTYKFSETYFIEALIYLILTTVTSMILNIIEKKLNQTSSSLPQSVTTPEQMKFSGKE